MLGFQIITGDALTALQAMPDASVDCCITSPPYWGLRDYGVEGHRRFVGIELNPTYVAMAIRRIQASVPGPALFNQATIC